MKSWKEDIPEGWEWNGMRWKGPKETAIWVFKNKATGEKKGFSAWQVQPPTNETAVHLLKAFIKTQGTGVFQ